MKTILYLHGFASSGQGAKAQFFREKFAAIPHITFDAFDFNPTPKDFEYMTITGQINRLRQYLLSRRWDKVSLIGSSMGGLVALNYAHRFGGVDRLLLLAPALAYLANRRPEAELKQWQHDGTIRVPHYAFDGEIPLQYGFYTDGLNYLQPVPPPTPLLIIHGQHDDVVPLAGSQKYVTQFPHQTQLLAVDSDHRLNDQLAVIWRQVESFLL